MAALIKVASVSDVPDGMMKKVTVNGTIIAIANVGGTFFALDDTCTHEQCSFADMGILDGKEILCGCHGARFDVASGKVLGPPATVDTHTYAVTVKDSDIFVSV